jgi:spore coat protein U-like protein
MSSLSRIRRDAVRAIAALLVAAPLAAQNNASANVTATVQQPVTVTKNNDLSFGNVFPGLNKSIAVTAGGAAKFTVAGQASTPVNLTFSLPATISSSGNTLPISTWTGHFRDVDQPTGGTSFTPSTSATAATLSASGGLFVYVGATAEPGSAQPAGSYSGTMTMTVVYF